jgi:hypothetical protein
MKSRHTYSSACLLALAALVVGAAPAFAAKTGPTLGSADFSVLSAAPDSGGAVTCTDSAITGNVGSSGAAASVVQTNCTIAGSVTAPVSDQVVSDFGGAYDALAGQACDSFLTGTLAGVTLSPGVYCFDAAATLTGTLTLDGNGSSTGTWLFRIGTSGTGALTGTDFSVALVNGAQACNVTWWVAEAATMTRGAFKGAILAGAAITVTGEAPASPFEGRALAKAAVTLTNSDFVGCTGGSIGGDARRKCNQGVGNGPEGCDPGNSNQGNPFRSNDELGGVPGNPGRNGGNK